MVLERLLTDWVNISYASTHWGDEAIARLIRRYPDLFPSSDPKLPYEHWSIIPRVQELLRKAWDTRDTRHRDWYVFKVRDNYRFNVVDMPAHRRLPGGEIPQGLDELPPLTLLEQAMVYFQRNADRARHCLSKECPAPCFFAPPKKSWQRYCSLKCAAQGLREQKTLVERKSREIFKRRMLRCHSDCEGEPTTRVSQ